MKLTAVERIAIQLGLELLKRDYKKDAEKCKDEKIKKVFTETIEKLKEKVRKNVD